MLVCLRLMLPTKARLRLLWHLRHLFTILCVFSLDNLTPFFIFQLEGTQTMQYGSEKNIRKDSFLFTRAIFNPISCCVLQRTFFLNSRKSIAFVAAFLFFFHLLCNIYQTKMERKNTSVFDLVGKMNTKKRRNEMMFNFFSDASKPHNKLLFSCLLREGRKTTSTSQRKQGWKTGKKLSEGKKRINACNEGLRDTLFLLYFFRFSFVC